MRAGQYVKREKMQFIGGRGLSKRWRELYEIFITSGAGYDAGQARDAARTRTIDELIINADSQEGYWRIAQTRIMASYGFLQITHYNATDWNLGGFGKKVANRNPELLNEYEYGFPAYVDRMAHTLNDAFGGPPPDHDWPWGYENGWFVALSTYNKKEPNYVDRVFELSENYEPR